MRIVRCDSQLDNLILLRQAHADAALLLCLLQAFCFKEKELREMVRTFAPPIACIPINTTTAPTPIFQCASTTRENVDARTHNRTPFALPKSRTRTGVRSQSRKSLRDHITYALPLADRRSAVFDTITPAREGVNSNCNHHSPIDMHSFGIGLPTTTSPRRTRVRSTQKLSNTADEISGLL